jgi:uncharacterized protein (DUF342 family)
MSHYFVRIEDAKDVRRQLLESSKLCIQILKQEHSIGEVRKHKQAVMQHIRDELKELTFLLSSLEKELPILTKKELLDLNPNAFKQVPEEAKVELSKIDKLEASLKMIQGRLDKL